MMKALRLNLPDVKKFAMTSIACVALFGSAVDALAANDYPKAIQGAVNAGVKVVKQFPAASGLTGWVLSDHGQYSIIYSTADKKTIIAGALIGESGENLNEIYAGKHFPKPDLTSLYQELEKSAYVAEGALTNPKNIIYVFVDANCPYCHYTWKALQPYEKAGLQVRWILVDTLGPTSMPKAIEVLAAQDKTAAFRKMEENHGKQWSAVKGMTAQEKPAIAQRIAQNGELMGRFGLRGTPGLVWKDKQGKINMKGGMPRLNEIPLITGLPEQKIDDPALNKFR
ncbi:thiol:disulfide interchange protein DsbG [Oxalobacteraceae bacterium R-40]|uniref:Thiol:disulfide interchange protein DsbG n=1 Tax=Keguizhuia sedimenti TaxID=3064264 RepID=A0ABU1BTL1_9BURK|nr:thiol:disulfide interchange protein DsbG [Oxalobacteraceae bacterium R-40]